MATFRLDPRPGGSGGASLIQQEQSKMSVLLEPRNRGRRVAVMLRSSLRHCATPLGSCILILTTIIIARCIFFISPLKEYSGFNHLLDVPSAFLGYNVITNFFPWSERSLEVDDAIGITDDYISHVLRNYGDVDQRHFHGGKVGFLPETDEPTWQLDELDHVMNEDELKESWKGYAFNTRMSRSLPLDREIESNLLPPECPSLLSSYGEVPPGSVVIVFHNEDLSVLLRSIHSVINRTEPKHLREIIIVDDDSNKETHPWLGEELDHHISNLPKVRIRRANERQGLMMARMRGAEWATSDILVFLDSHIEASMDWYVPLADSIFKEPRRIVVPRIPGINGVHFTHEKGGVGAITFSWTLGQVHLQSPDTAPHVPYPSPAMAGGLFAVNRTFFMDVLGGYDDELRLYGGEEFEIGFKAWMCGGEIYVIPCSRVYHIFRVDTYWKGQVYKVPGHEIARNKHRIAHVWMDEYADLAVSSMQRLEEDNGVGDLNKALDVRLKCLEGRPSRTFKWYLDEVATTVWRPNHQAEDVLLGQIKNEFGCLDHMAGKGIGGYPCHDGGGTQMFMVAKHGEEPIRVGSAKLKKCVSGEEASKGVLMVAKCEEAETFVVEFLEDSEKEEFRLRTTGDLCLSLNSMRLVKFETCDGSETTFSLRKSNVYQPSPKERQKLETWKNKAA